jgi:hypothetical protein
MGLQVIPTDSTKLTSGERKVLEKIKALYRDIDYEAFLYIQPRIRHLEPDFILIDSQRGVTIIEVKDWGLSYIVKADRRKMHLVDGKEVDNPIFKTNQYFNATQGLFSMQELLLNDNAELKFKLQSYVIFPNLHSSEISTNHLAQIFHQPPSKYIPSDSFSGLNMEHLFNNDYSFLSNEEIMTIRTLLFPEIKINKSSSSGNTNMTKDLIAALDAEQEHFAKRISYGHYMVTGVPGSGKTVLLLARAIHLVREHPEWKIKILTYNKSLTRKIENKINSLAADLKFMDVKLENIDISTFHKFALNIASIGVPQGASDEWWDEELPRLSLEKVKPEYDAILIDEYQDFRDDWIRLCVKACREHSYLKNNKEDTKGINIFLAGDRLQSIYNNNDHSWKSLGINMQGKSKLLKKSYRSGDEHIDLALRFLKQIPSLESEVNKFYCPMNELTFENHIKDGISFIEGLSRNRRNN